MRHDGHAEEELAESAHLMHQITGGHPLHVIYATGHLVNSGEGLSRWSIEHIPGDLSKDVRTYYDSLWLKLSYAQKRYFDPAGRVQIYSACEFHLVVQYCYRGITTKGTYMRLSIFFIEQPLDFSHSTIVS